MPRALPVRPAARLALLLAGPLALAGCGTWPKEIGGGMAEYARPALTPTQANSLAGRHMACSVAALNRVAVQAAARGRDGGRIATLQETANRAEREFAGHMCGDSARTLVALDTGLAAFTGAVPCGGGAGPEDCTA